MSQRPIQIHLVVTHDSGREAAQTYMRDDKGWHCHQEGLTIGERITSFHTTNDALFAALESMREAFGTLHEPGDAPLPELIPVDTRETSSPAN